MRVVTVYFSGTLTSPFLRASSSASDGANSYEKKTKIRKIAYISLIDNLIKKVVIPILKQVFLNDLVTKDKLVSVGKNIALYYIK